jgi:hypothetical protein
MKDRWLSEIDAVERDARAVLDGLTAQQANHQPEPGRWSIAQNIEHAAKTAIPYIERIEEGLREPGARTLRAGFLAKLLVRSMEPPPRMRVKTFRSLEPSPAVDVERAIDEFIAVHERLAEAIRTNEQADFLKASFRSPYMALFSVRLDQGVDTLLAHARRHLWQARQVRRAIGVPG